MNIFSKYFAVSTSQFGNNCAGLKAALNVWRRPLNACVLRNACTSYELSRSKFTDNTIAVTQNV